MPDLAGNPTTHFDFESITQIIHPLISKSIAHAHTHNLCPACLTLVCDLYNFCPDRWLEKILFSPCSNDPIEINTLVTCDNSQWNCLLAYIPNVCKWSPRKWRWKSYKVTYVWKFNLHQEHLYILYFSLGNMSDNKNNLYVASQFGKTSQDSWQDLILSHILNLPHNPTLNLCPLVLHSLLWAKDCVLTQSTHLMICTPLYDHPLSSCPPRNNVLACSTSPYNPGPRV